MKSGWEEGPQLKAAWPTVGVFGGRHYIDGVVRDSRPSTVDFLFFLILGVVLVRALMARYQLSIPPAAHSKPTRHPPATWLPATGNRQIRAELEPVGRRLCQKKIIYPKFGIRGRRAFDTWRLLDITQEFRSLTLTFCDPKSQKQSKSVKKLHVPNA